MFHGGEDLDESVEHSALEMGRSDTLEKSYCAFGFLRFQRYAECIARIWMAHDDVSCE